MELEFMYIIEFFVQSSHLLIFYFFSGFGILEDCSFVRSAIFIWICDANLSEM